MRQILRRHLDNKNCRDERGPRHASLLQPTTQVGKYYLSNGGTENKCPYASCSNAGLGQKYTPGFVTAKDPKCPTQNCPKFASPGFYFATAGSCDATKCNPTDEIGTYFTKGCEVGECTNGKARSNPIHIPHTSLDDRYVWGLVGKNRIYFDGFKLS